MTTEERWMSVEDIATHLGVKPTTVYRWIEGLGMPAHRVGRLWMLKKSEVDEWVRANRPGSGLGTTHFGMLARDSAPDVLEMRRPEPDRPSFLTSQARDEGLMCQAPSARSTRDLFESDVPVTADKPEVGRVLGLAAVGRSGQAVPVTVVAARGKGRVVPMGGAPLFLSESARAAARYLRRMHDSLGLSREWLASFDLGVLCDAADLPDQGLTLAATVGAALVSALTGRPVRPRVAVFGSLSEEGRIEPADRVHERLRAARSAGIRQVLLPLANAEELPSGTTMARSVETIPVGEMSELLERVLLERDAGGLDLV